MRCRIYSIGFSVNNYFGKKVNHLGGRDLVDDVNNKDETTNFIVTDWQDGYPNMGGRIAGKNFFITKGSKLSYSNVFKNQFFSNPIKILLVSGFNFRKGRITPDGYKLENGNLVPTDGAILEEGSTSQYVGVLRDDVVHKSRAMQEFFDEIDEGKEGIPFNVGDAFTYVFRDSEGLKPIIYYFFISDIGAFTSSGAQVYRVFK